ncbi:MAG: hydrogenase maturation nickel metallochaperone HypA [Chloroflexi bacterium]|nr:hydrogenase maturation nickel metallochaperone HypA [Chloroflexota bacterium]
MPKIPRLSAIIDHLLRQTKHPASVHIAVGELTSFTEEQIRSQWSTLINDTALAQTSLFIRMIPAEQQCMVCFQKYHPSNKETSCPRCGSVGAKIIAGEEFYLDSIKEENE